MFRCTKREVSLVAINCARTRTNRTTRCPGERRFSFASCRFCWRHHRWPMSSFLADPNRVVLVCRRPQKGPFSGRLVVVQCRAQKGVKIQFNKLWHCVTLLRLCEVWKSREMLLFLFFGCFVVLAVVVVVVALILPCVGQHRGDSRRTAPWWWWCYLYLRKLISAASQVDEGCGQT